MLTNLACPIRRAWNYMHNCTEITPQTHLESWYRRLKKCFRNQKVLNKWLCTVQLFPRAWILEILRKVFRISLSVSGSRLKAVFGYLYPVESHYPARYPTSKPDSDHLYQRYDRLMRAAHCSKQLKTYLFVPFVRLCMHHNYRVILGSHAAEIACGIQFGCRALYSLPWRASVSSHQVQCKIPTFEALQRKNMYLFLERCRKSNNMWLRALMQSDCLYSHFTLWMMIELCSVCCIDGVSCHNAFAFYLDSTSLGIWHPSSVVGLTSVTC